MTEQQNPSYNIEGIKAIKSRLYQKGKITVIIGSK
jgi:nicotinic acid mononucleotide adenylyltransferase